MIDPSGSLLCALHTVGGSADVLQTACPPPRKRGFPGSVLTLPLITASLEMWDKMDVEDVRSPDERSARRQYSGQVGDLTLIHRRTRRRNDRASETPGQTCS